MPVVPLRAKALADSALDMETAALYALARSLGKRAATVLTVSDVIPTRQHYTPEQRQAAFGSVADVVLGALLEQPGGA